MSKQNKLIDFSSNDDLVNLVHEEKNKCIGCKLCMRGCPMLDEFCENPKELLIELDNNKYFDMALPYSCMMCSYCSKVCPKNVSLKNIFFKFRQEVIKSSNYKTPRNLNAMPVLVHQKLLFSNFFSDPISCKNSESEQKYVFFPGCALIGNSPKLVQKIYTYLKEKIPGIGYWNACCGKPTNFLGNSNLFQKYLTTLENEYRKKNITKIIVACENCFKSFKENCNDLEVISLYNIMSEIGLPKGSINKFSDYPEKINIHDPCPIRDEIEMQDNVRKILIEMGFEIEELKFSKEKTICCGSGGMVPLTAKYIANKHTTRRAGDGDKMMVTYCSECVTRIGHYGRKIVHILELIFYEKQTEYKLKSLSSIQVWKNRYFARRIAKNEAKK